LDRLRVTLGQAQCDTCMSGCPPRGGLSKTDKLYQLFIGRSDGAILCLVVLVLQAVRSYRTFK